MSQDMVYRIAIRAEDKRQVIRLRELVYVHDQGRLNHASDMAATFDRFDAFADYILAEYAGQPVGAIKVVRDSALGLPCEDIVDLSEFGAGHRLVELGHLMTVPKFRTQHIGMGLMRAGLVHGVRWCGATRLVGDFFVDNSGALRSFYQAIGFVPLGEPYRDERFAGAPLSLVAGLDLAEAAARLPASKGKVRDLLQFFFHDYAELRRGYLQRQALAEPEATHNYPIYRP